MRYQQLDKRSKAIDAEAWNRHDQAARMVHNLNVVPPLKLKRDHQGMLLSVDLPPSQRRVSGATGSVQQFRITDPNFPDTIKAEPWDGETATGDAVHIAKPWELRISHLTSVQQTYYPGLRFTLTTPGIYSTVTVVGGGTFRTETWNVAPIYFAANVIIAFATEVPHISVSGEEVEWLDLNQGARKWSLVPRAGLPPIASQFSAQGVAS